ncbi:RsmB/NOP family class I SAM-dependent RNA methyltransferase [Catenovulum sp. 2E275]|uniref:RsmB/NOP family class I SAM-dependent RNA methyltransferase n=1 Tax=Catenovulum sp. 2E275 TaxID=2980497 RepID=UPI0021D22770|nr:RsmB/NOP family class I SAM-dependent RNA methyltransferase [Catenovulum sp. 2E275]MCU4676178.1 RsmB/NOP family class I SAM-dependent RNA methyltransferase [Catenovulum sp. 2E275]
MRSFEKSYLYILWQDWLNQDEFKPLDRWLKNWFKGNREINRQQKLGLSQAMFTAMRFLQAADYLVVSYRENQWLDDPLNWDKNWRIFQLNSITNDEFWSAIVALNHYFKLPELTWFSGKPAPNAAEQYINWLDSQMQSVSADGQLVLSGMRPQWQALLTQRALLNNWSDDKLSAFCLAQLSSPPLWLRLTETTDANALVTALKQQGVEAVLSSSLPTFGIEVNGGFDVTQTKAYKQGEFEIQDLASQQIAQAVKAKPGDKVWDACAGAGGKSLAIAAKMNNKGCVVATDLHEYKLAEVKKRAKRANLFNIRTFSWDGAAKLRLPKEAAQQKGFDWVLVDAPCTSAGTWRRNPDAKWRFTEADTQAQLAIQQQILSYAHFAVRAGGHLVYATCSWQISENEAQVAEFLALNPNFKLVSQTLLGAPEINSDTMFVAVMQKQA